MTILSRGDAGEAVQVLQQVLGVPADGQFGPATESALIAYQDANDLDADGIAGPDTFAQMRLYDLILLEVGTQGETVERMQQMLGVAADGVFGPNTEHAVRAFQAEQGLDVDGVAGPVTLGRLGLFA
jgi:peptidoglycan hydrolase-like protein with peptidoglycan-binding domain